MLVDTSVWIDHLRHGETELTAALQAGRVDMHPFVVGELACGHCDACRLRLQGFRDAGLTDPAHYVDKEL